MNALWKVRVVRRLVFQLYRLKKPGLSLAFFPVLQPKAYLRAKCNLVLMIYAEGSHCKLENDKTGVCKKIHDCPSKLQEVMEGKRSSDSMERCGFQDFTEIVCCQYNITDKIGLRPAEIGMIYLGWWHTKSFLSLVRSDKIERLENWIRDREIQSHFSVFHFN